MELYSWAQVIKEFDRLYHEAKKNNPNRVDSEIFTSVTLEMLIQGCGNHIGYKYPENLKAFRIVLSKLKKDDKSEVKINSKRFFMGKMKKNKANKFKKPKSLVLKGFPKLSEPLPEERESYWGDDVSSLPIEMQEKLNLNI